jgi:hypothetical protein
MLNKGTLSGPVWRIAPLGCVQVFFVSRTRDNLARVCPRGHLGTWARKSLEVPLKDLFLEELECRTEYSVRKQAALAANPLASLNLATPLQEA